jgi:hypothetical protein
MTQQDVVCLCPQQDRADMAEKVGRAAKQRSAPALDQCDDQEQS